MICARIGCEQEAFGKMKYCSRECAPLGHLSSEQDRRKPKKEKSPTGEKPPQWKAAVDAAKLLKAGPRGSRLAIAEIALKSKKWGCVREFAQAAGISYQTLSTWTATKTQVIDRLPAGLYSDALFAAAVRARNHVTRFSLEADVRRKFEREVERESEIRKSRDKGDPRPGI